MIVEQIQKTLNKNKRDSPTENDKELATSTTLLFSAHGLPEKIVKRGDPYQKQIEEHVQILSQMLEKQ